MCLKGSEKKNYFLLKALKNAMNLKLKLKIFKYI